MSNYLFMLWVFHHKHKSLIFQSSHSCWLVLHMSGNCGVPPHRFCHSVGFNRVRHEIRVLKNDEKCQMGMITVCLNYNITRENHKWSILIYETNSTCPVYTFGMGFSRFQPTRALPEKSPGPVAGCLQCFGQNQGAGGRWKMRPTICT